MTAFRPLLVLLALATAACAPLPQRTLLPVEQRPSPNYDERRPSFVVLHHTGSGNVSRALSTLTSRDRAVSSHYVIARDGRIYYLVDELRRAWHAGESYWAGHRDLNSASIGIELDNDGEEPFAEAQIGALLGLLADLRARHGIAAANFLGHADVAPRRKTDPSRHFPWQRLASQGFGLWCEPPFPSASGTDGLLLLSALGYDVSDSAAAIAAFKRRFQPHDTSPGLSDEDLGRLQCLLKKKMGSEQDFDSAASRP